jgi:hypothetical protein
LKTQKKKKISMQQGDAAEMVPGWGKCTKNRKRDYLKKMNMLKERINISKSKIDCLKLEHGNQVQAVFTECARMVNPFEQIGTVAKHKVISRAHYKMAELMFRFQLLDKCYTPDENLNVVFLCEAPGGFVEYVGRWFQQFHLKHSAAHPETRHVRPEWKGYCISLISEEERAMQNPLRSLGMMLPQESPSEPSEPPRKHARRSEKPPSREKPLPPKFRPSSPQKNMVKEFELGTTTITVDEAANEFSQSEFSQTGQYEFTQGGTLGATLHVPAKYGTVTLGENFSVPSSFRPSSPVLVSSAIVSPVVAASPPFTSPFSTSYSREQSLIYHSPPQEVYTMSMREKQKNISESEQQRHEKFHALVSPPQEGAERTLYENGKISMVNILQTLK